MDYQETLNYLFSQLPMYQRVGASAYKSDLENTIKLCRLLGNPENSFRSVHIAGTNGKGSVSHMLASILQEKGLKTGLYTSPHLKDFRERIRLNGAMIPIDSVVRFVEKYKADFGLIQPSFFEMTVGLAFDFFREEKVDIAVIETGLGGRLDSTNVITPLLSVITNISFDHKQLLGDTLEKIAKEKAGIIKQRVPVVIGESQQEIKHVFVNRARETRSDIHYADQEFSTGRTYPSDPLKGILKTDIIKEGSLWLEELESPPGGDYQKKNILTVCGACEQLSTVLGNISRDEIRRGILRVRENTGFAGRWQIISTTPLTICDTGHNEAGIKLVLEQINKIPHETLHIVFGMVNDKEIDSVLSLLPRKAIYYFCKADIPRGLDAGELALKSQKYRLRGETYLSVNQALKSAQENAGKSDLVFVGGSTFVVAEVL